MFHVRTEHHGVKIRAGEEIADLQPAGADLLAQRIAECLLRDPVCQLAQRRVLHIRPRAVAALALRAQTEELPELHAVAHQLFLARAELRAAGRGGMEHAALQRQKPDVVDRQRLALGRVIEVVRHQPQQRRQRRAVLSGERLLHADAGLDVHLSGVARVRDLLIEHGELRLQQRVHLLLRRVRRQRDRAIQRVEVLRRAAVPRG